MEKQLKQFFKFLEMDKKADLAITGIGNLQKDSITMEDPMLDEKTKNEILAKHGVGEIIGRILDADGHFIDTEFHNKLMALSPEDFKQIPVRVGAAGGMEKKEAILSVLKGEWINVLITDEEVANYLLEI